MSLSRFSARTGSFWSETAQSLPGAVVLCVASLVSGGLGALITLRLYFGPQAPGLWHMLRLVFSHAVER